MVDTRQKKTGIPFVPISYMPPKRPRGKRRLQSQKPKDHPEMFDKLTMAVEAEILQSERDDQGKDELVDNKSVVDMTAIDPEFDKVFATERVAEIIGKCRVNKKSEPPRIPLCRILRNEAVRAISQCDLKMREILRNDGYLPEKGKFVLSMKTIKGNYVALNDSIRSKWNDYWKEVNDEFENELQSSEDWKELSGKMFLCWDGNHRTVAWMEEIRSNHQFCFEKDWHIRVSVSFIDVDKCHVQQLISALNRINELNEDGVVVNTMKDTLYSVRKIATASLEQYRSKLDPKYLATLKTKDNASLGTRTDQWYQLPRLAYCKMLFQRKMDEEVLVEMKACKERDDKEEFKTAATKRVHDKWVQKMGKLLAIVNPQLGQSWFDAVTRADIDTKTSRLSIEKLLEMVKAKIPNEIRDRWVHWMSSGTAIHSTYGIPKGDKSFKEWLKKEVWLEHLIENSCEVFKETSKTYALHIEVPHGGDLENWFRAFKLTNRASMFKSYHKHMSANVPLAQSYEIGRCSRRVCYRYYKHLHRENILDKFPGEVENWKSKDENCMYSKRGNLDRPGGLSDYELQNCPWWIDFVVGEYPIEEEMEYKSNVKVPSLKRIIDLDEKGTSNVDSAFDEKSIKRRKSRNDKASDIQDDDLQVLDANVEESVIVPSFDILKIVTDVDIELHCANILHAYEQYSNKIECLTFQRVRDFAKRHSRMTHKYSRGGIARDWGFDLVIIDFPTNDLPSAEYYEIPEWNKCNTSLMQASFSFGTLCLDDDGWLVSITSAEQSRMLEKEAISKCLEACRTYCLYQESPFGVVKDRMGTFEKNVLLVTLWSRKGMKPSIQANVVPSNKCLSFSKASLGHFFVPGSKLEASLSTPGRKSSEKSISFMEFLIENLSPKKGIVLDLFSGTGSALIASAILSRHCYGIESDKLLVDHVNASRLSTLTNVKKSNDMEMLSPIYDSDEEVPKEDDEPL